MCRMQWVSGSEAWNGFVDTVRQMDLQKMRCVNCGCSDDSMILGDYLIERLFVVVGLIAGALNLAGVAAVAVQISWILFLIGIVLLAIHLFTNRSVRVP